MMAIAQKCSLALSPLPGKWRKGAEMLVPLLTHNTIVFALPFNYLEALSFLKWISTTGVCGLFYFYFFLSSPKEI